MRASRLNSYEVDFRSLIIKGQHGKANLENSVNVCVLEYSHHLHGDTLSADQALPEISEPSAHYLLTNFVQFGKRKASRMKARSAREPHQSLKYQRFDGRKGVEIQQLFVRQSRPIINSCEVLSVRLVRDPKVVAHLPHGTPETFYTTRDCGKEELILQRVRLCHGSCVRINVLKPCA